jgi:Leucine-rich repeat (LRR) protein
VPAGPARQAALSTIETWTKRFPGAQIVVTSRPGAVPEGSLPEFTLVRLDELDEAQRRRFVDHWHRALGRQLRWPEGHPLLAQLAAGVRLEFERQRALDDLAANPLLCGSLCALHWDRRREAARAAFKNNEMLELGTTILPATRWRICDALTEMLLERREREQPDFYIKDFPQEYRLLYEQKATILSEVAWAMVEDDMRSTITRKNAEAAVRRALRSRRDRLDAKAPAVLTALVERSGLLRGAGEDEIEFAHNTLKAFLAARHYLNAGVATPLARKLVHAELEELRSGLDEVAVFCAASPTGQRFATSLIEKLANGAQELAQRGESERARWLRMLALRCEMSAERLGARKRRVTQDLAVDVFPPRDMEEARQLAALGEEGIARLAPRAGASDEEAAAAVRCLRLIGSEAADAAIDAYHDFTAPAVLEELVQVRHPLTLPAVLAAAQDDDRWRELAASVKTRVVDADPLTGLTNLQSFDLSDTQVADLHPLEGLTDLRKLTFRSTRVADVHPLEGLTNLQSLDLGGTLVASLRPLEGLTNLQVLLLDGTQVADLRPLEGLTNLQCLLLSGTQVADADLRPLEGLSNLQSLELSGTQVADLRPLKGVTNLQWLSLERIPVADLRPLKGLANLQVLYLGETQVADLRPLEGLANLQQLTLDGTQVADLCPLEGLTSLQYLNLNDTQVADLGPLESLTRLESLHLVGTQVADVRPLEGLIDLVQGRNHKSPIGCRGMLPCRDA